MKICIADKADKEDLKLLWKHCFNDDDKFINFWFDTVFRPENTVIAITDNRISGALQLIPYDICINENIIKSAYICGVGVYKNYRNLGIGSELMHYAHAHLRKSGFELAILISEVDDFYQKLGYKTGSSKYLCELPATNNTVKYTVVKNNFDISDMKKVYESYCKNYNGFIKRERREFSYLVNHYSMYPGGTYLIYINDVPSAYIICEIENKTVTADEIAYINDDGFNAAIDFINSNSVNKALIATGEFEKSVLTPKSTTRTIWYMPLTATDFYENTENCFLSIL